MTDAEIEVIRERWTDKVEIAERLGYDGFTVDFDDVGAIFQALAEKDRRIAELEAELQIRGPSGEPTLEEAMRKVMEVKQ